MIVISSISGIRVDFEGDGDERKMGFRIAGAGCCATMKG